MARMFRSMLNANGELGSGLALMGMSLATLAMLEPDLFSVRLVTLSGKAQALFDILAGIFFIAGMVQTIAVLADRRGLRLWNAYGATILWMCAAVAFFQVKFFGSVVLSLCMVVINGLAVVRGRLKVQEWERFGCGNASTCANRVPSPNHVEDF